MRFGIQVCTQFPPGADVRAGIDGTVGVVQEARRLGFESVFVLQHFRVGTPFLQPVPFLAHLASAVPGMRLGTAVLIAPLLPPVQLAEDALTMQQLTGGRFVLGLGAGYRHDEFEAFGVERKGRFGRLEETVASVRDLWHQDANLADAPPLWLGTSSEGGIRRAARIADAWLAPPNVKLRWLRGHLDLYRDALSETGRDVDGADYPVIREMYVGERPEDVGREAEPYAREEYGAYADHGLDFFRERFDELQDKAFLFGTADEVGERVQMLHEAGVTEVVLRATWLGMPPAAGAASLARFAEQVMPSFSS